MQEEADEKWKEHLMFESTGSVRRKVSTLFTILKKIQASKHMEIMCISRLCVVV